MVPGCSGYHYCTTLFNKAWTQVLHRLKSCSENQDAEDLWQWSCLEIKLNTFRRSTTPQNQFTIFIIIIIIIFHETKIVRIERFSIHHTFKVHRKLTSWTKIHKLWFFSSTDRIGDSRGGLFLTCCISFQLNQTWSPLKNLLDILY